MLDLIEMQDLVHWRDFYENNAKYFKVGRVVLPPIDPSVPVPEPCEEPVAQKTD